MPPKVALLLTLGFMGVLFWRDIREKPNITRAIWLPIVWMFLVASKPVSQWLSTFGLPGFAATSVEGGSSLDAFVFLGLTALGICVLSKRQVSLLEVLRDNAWLTAFVLYCFLAVFWADLPFVSFKRWIKILGHPIMVLILLTEPDPREALVRLIKRCAYVILPVSILWIKYYPALGRRVSEFGAMTNSGIAVGSNVLAGICAILGLFFLWHFFQIRRTSKSKRRRNELRLIVGLLLMSGYCLGETHSATADFCLFLGAVTMMLLGLRFVNKRLIGTYVLAAVAIFLVAEGTFGISSLVYEALGRDSTLTGRTELWKQLWEFDTNPLFGVGFESFWLGDRALVFAEGRSWQPNQAHNGYLELYLNLGIVGLLIFAGVIFAIFLKIRLDLLRNFEWGRFQMGCLVAILFHNWTEAGFKGLSFPFLVFFILAVNYRQLRIGPVAPPLEATVPEEETELVYSDDKV